MPYSAEVVHRARQALESAKTEKEILQQQRLQKVYEALPQVRQLDDRLQESMLLAAQAVFSREPGSQQALEEAKKANLALQEERNALIAATFGEGYLDESPICPRCGGVGYVGTQMCECLKELCRQEQKKQLQLLSCGHCDFADFKLEYYPDRRIPGSQVTVRKLMEKTYRDCRSYAQTFPEHRESLLFSGDTGLGKTFLSACIAAAVTEQGYSVVYESAVHLFAKMEKAKFNNDEEAAAQTEKYSQCDLLIIDDLGTELAGQFVTSALYGLVNDRLMSGKATIISTNLTADELEQRYSPQILSRLRGSYRRVAFVGDDIRILKSRGKVQ